MATNGDAVRKRKLRLKSRTSVFILWVLTGLLSTVTMAALFATGPDLPKVEYSSRGNIFMGHPHVHRRFMPREEKGRGKQRSKILHGRSSFAENESNEVTWKNRSMPTKDESAGTSITNYSDASPVADAKEVAVHTHGRGSSTLPESTGATWTNGTEGGTVEEVERPSPLVLTIGTKSMDDFFHNWYISALKSGIEPSAILIGVFDDEMEDVCKRRGYHYRRYSDLQSNETSVLTGGKPLHGSAQPPKDARPLQRMAALKIELLRRILNEFQRPVLLMDTDTVFLRDARIYLRKEPMPQKADIAISSDCLDVGEEMRRGGCVSAALNTGIIHFQPSEQTTTFLERWRNETNSGGVSRFETEQGIFNRLIREGGMRRDNTSWYLFRTWNGNLKLGTLPIESFAGGHVYFVQRLPQKRNITPFVAHTTFQFSHLSGKRQRLRETHLWFNDGPDYYNATGKSGFVTWQPAVPPSVDGSKLNVTAHLELASYYRLALRNVIAIGEILNRTVIIPRLRCLCDRWWANVLPTCQIRPSTYSGPFQPCPLDHLFFIPNLEEAGVDFREHSFLEHPNVPNQRKQVHTVGVEGSQNSTESYDLTIPAMPSEDEIIRYLAKENAPVLEFADPINSFCRFRQSERGAQFDKRMDKALNADCFFCAPGEKGGRECEVGFDKPLPSEQTKCTRVSGEEWQRRFFYRVHGVHKTLP